MNEFLLKVRQLHFSRLFYPKMFNIKQSFFIFVEKAQLLSKYNLKYGAKKFANSPSRVLLGSNIDNCALSCNVELGFECKSFDFCYMSGDCRLSNNSLSTDDQDYKDSFDCDVYEKDTLFHYVEYPSKSSVNKNDLSYGNVGSPSECASKCDAQTDKLHCRSFNYCPESKTCYLSEKHLIDSIETLNEDLVCTHYSSSFNILKYYSFTIRFVF